jgi:dolichol-phosphate mannosyltransferase
MKTKKKLFSKKMISIIVPTYNQEKGIHEFYLRVKSILIQAKDFNAYEIIFVNDASTDKTLNALESIAKIDTNARIINFSRNFGNQIGITAGIDYAGGDVVIVIDDDLQDPPEVILEFIKKWKNGYKVVYGVRESRIGISFLFNFITRLYYKFIARLSDVHIPLNTGDFRLIDRIVIDELKKIKEENRYYRGLVSWVGFPQIGVLYRRDERFAGKSNFTFKKYFNFALSGITAFTEKPLYYSSYIGLLITILSFIMAIYLVVNKIFNPSVSIQGWTSMIVIILFFGGVQLLSLGIIGIYISKIYREVKKRPLYIVESTKNLH